MFPDSIQTLNLSKLVGIWSAYWRLWGVRIRIKLKPVSWLQSQITPVQLKPSKRPDSESALKLPVEELLEMHEVVRLAARCHYGAVTCLPRALVLADIIKSHGLNARVVVGVNKTKANLASHAWVECDGVPVGEPENVTEEFAELGFRNDT